MGDDIASIAENKLDAMEAEELANASGEDNLNNEGEGDLDGLQEGDEEQGEDGEEEEDGEEGSGEEDDGEGSGDDEEESDELSDDELIELAKKRGLDLAKKEEPKKSEEVVRPKELDEDTWGNMNEVQRTIYSGLPYMNIRGKNSEGEVISLKIKTPEQLPDDFEFLNKREEASFISDVTAQSKRAEEAYAKIAGMTQQQRQAQAQQEESRRVVADVERLQKDNIIPRIKAKAGTPEFNNDPSVKLVNEVLNYWKDLQDKGEGVSVYTAAKLFRADNPDKFAGTKSKADGERKRIAGKVKGSGRGGKGASAKDTGRPRFAPGTSASDIADYYANDLD